MSRNHDRPFDIDGAFLRFLEENLRELSGEPEVGEHAATAETLAARAVWFDAVMKATRDLLDHDTTQEYRGGSLFYCAETFAALVGAAIGSKHERFCPDCFQNNAPRLLSAMQAGMLAEIDHNREQQGSPRHAAAH